MGEYDWVIGVSFSIASSILSCLGLIFQKYAHNQNQQLPDDQKYPVMLGIVCSPCWWASFIMMGLFPFPFDFFAYSFAAQSLVVPFAGLTLIMNQFFAPFILKEKVYRIDIYASVVVFIGCTMTTVTGNHDSESYVLQDLLHAFKSSAFISGGLALCVIMIVMTASLMMTDPLKQPQQKTTTTNLEIYPGHRTAPSLSYEHEELDTDSQYDSDSQYDTDDAGGQSSVVHDQDLEDSNVPPRKLWKLTVNTGTHVAVTDPEPPEKRCSLKRCAKGLEYANFAMRPFYYGFVAGGLGALQNIFFKSVGVLMKSSVFDDSEEGKSAWSTWYPYVFIVVTLVLAISQLSMLNKGMSRYDAILVFPLYNAMYILSSVTMGALYYGEFDDFSAPEISLFVVGILITISGIILFVFKPRENNDEAGKSNVQTTTSREHGAYAPPVQTMQSLDSLSYAKNTLSQV